APGERDTLDDMVDQIEATRVRLGVGPWVFWGLSGGGWLAQLYAHRHPRGLAGLIIESVCACFRERLGDPACIVSPFHPAWRGTLDAAGLISPTSHASPAPTDDGEWLPVAGIGHVLRRPSGPALPVPPAVAPRPAAHLWWRPVVWAF